jgi:hypothetical protein
MKRRSLIAAAIGAMVAPAYVSGMPADLSLSNLRRIVADLKKNQAELVEVIVHHHEPKFIFVAFNGLATCVPTNRPVYVTRSVAGLMARCELNLEYIS